MKPKGDGAATQRVEWEDGSFVDLPARAYALVSSNPRWCTLEAGPPPRPEHVLLRGHALHAVPPWTVFSCGGLLAKLPLRADACEIAVYSDD
jgi:hypothetical protein